MRIFKTNKMIFAVVTAFIMVSTLPLLQSCNSSENAPMLQSKQLEFLDMDVSNLQNPSEDQKIILKKAKDRIDSYVVLKNKEYCLTVTKGSEIQMSQNLFELIKTTIRSTNSLIANLNVVVDKNNPRLLHIVQSRNLGKNTRFKVLGYESNPVDNQDSWNVDWDGIHIYLNHETTKSLVNAMYIGATVTEITAILMGSSGVGIPAATVTAIVGAVIGCEASVISNMNEDGGVELTPGLFGYDIESRYL